MWGPAAFDEGDRVGEPKSTEALVERVRELDLRLDPEPSRRGRLIADLVTVGLIAPVLVAWDVHIRAPALLVGLLFGGLLLRRLGSHVATRGLRRERDHLLDGKGPESE